MGFCSFVFVLKEVTVWGFDGSKSVSSDCYVYGFRLWIQMFQEFTVMISSVLWPSSSGSVLPPASYLTRFYRP